MVGPSSGVQRVCEDPGQCFIGLGRWTKASEYAGPSGLRWMAAGSVRQVVEEAVLEVGHLVLQL